MHPPPRLPAPPPSLPRLAPSRAAGVSEKLSAAEETISHLNGHNLNPLSGPELQELAGSLKRALSHAERMIDLRYQEGRLAAA